LLTELESAGQLPLLAQWRQDLARNPQLFFARVFRHCQNLPGNVLGADQIKVVLHAELGRLRDDARRQAREALERTNDSVEKDSLARRCKGQVVVFLEQVDQYGDVLRVLLEQILKDADAAGLGPSNDPVPVVMTFTRAGPLRRSGT